jgi:hypothetical protein
MNAESRGRVKVERSRAFLKIMFQRLAFQSLEIGGAVGACWIWSVAYFLGASKGLASGFEAGAAPPFSEPS